MVNFLNYRIKTRFAVNDNIKNDSEDLNSRRSRVEREDGKSSKTAVQSITSFDRSVDNCKNVQKSPRRLSKLRNLYVTFYLILDQFWSDGQAYLLFEL